MQYRTNEKNGDSLSVLGFGCMRFTKKGNSIDQEKAESEMKRAMDLGVNYFDTAYTYAGSEECLGKFIERYDCRDKIKIATKLPQYYVKRSEDFDTYFNEELKRLKTDYVDYYLLHMLNDASSFERLCELGLKEWIKSKKDAGQIRNIGFSFHGGTAKFIELIDAYDWEFAQVQFNYVDEHSQAGIEGIRYANKKGIPIIIMEPLRGGRLANNLPAEALKQFDSGGPRRTPADWGLRWIWNHPEINVVLSGMNDVSQIEENVRIASEATPGSLSAGELAVYARALEVLNKSIRVGCTGCGYCQPCSQGVDIPGCFSAYNHTYTDRYSVGFREYFMCTTLRRNRTNAGRCIECGKCEKVCPQSIPIRAELKNVKKRLENPVFKVVAWFAGKSMKY